MKYKLVVKVVNTEGDLENTHSPTVWLFFQIWREMAGTLPDYKMDLWGTSIFTSFFTEGFSKLATDFNALHLTSGITSQLRITFIKSLLTSVNPGHFNSIFKDILQTNKQTTKKPRQPHSELHWHTNLCQALWKNK